MVVFKIWYKQTKKNTKIKQHTSICMKYSYIYMSLKLDERRTEMGLHIWSVSAESWEKDERQRKRRRDVLELLLCFVTAGYCR